MDVDENGVEEKEVEGCEVCPGCHKLLHHQEKHHLKDKPEEKGMK